MKLDLILDNEGLALVLNLLWELGRDGVVSGCILNNETFITFHSLEDSWLLDSPFSNVCPFLILVRALCVLLGVRWLPSSLPVVCELLDEVAFDGCRLEVERAVFNCRMAVVLVNDGIGAMDLR